MVNKIVMFSDGVAPSPYTLETLKTKSMGGTEASCLRIISRLSSDGYIVWLEQRNRTEVTVEQNIHFIPLNSPTFNLPDTVITLRDAGHYLANKKRFPNAKHYLWMHDVVSGDYADHMNYHLNGQEADLICVSDWHKGNIEQSVRSPKRLKVNRVYGPLADYCVKAPYQEYDPFKLVFFSSPHKGLKNTLDIFVKLHKLDKRFYVNLSNPGYFKDAENLPEGVHNVGSLPHHSMVMDQVRTALCTFYPNNTFAETFGLVMAESNAVGTPVIAHRIGAAPEVLSHTKEILDCSDHDSVVKRVMDWHNGERPIVKAKKEFTMNEVIKGWKKLI